MAIRTMVAADPGSARGCRAEADAAPGHRCDDSGALRAEARRARRRTRGGAGRRTGRGTHPAPTNAGGGPPVEARRRGGHHRGKHGGVRRTRPAPRRAGARPPGSTQRTGVRCGTAATVRDAVAETTTDARGRDRPA
ncbi:hypothetical protein GCM10010266_19440 [Streptomyces griseomycini]|nr:hypothetical protein GCM10010266_19440 [Streptomyces griseomycini]GGR06194.1 hypothetical protein GCM10015536_08810 [Streptomyces griseomycini]